MAAACALTAAAVLLPLTVAGGNPDAGAAGAAAAHGSAGAQPAKADTCQNPEASLTPSAADGATIDRIKKAGKLVAGVDQNSFRWGYRNPATGQLEGFDIDLVRAVAQEILGDPEAVIYRAIPTSQRIPALKDGRVDIVVRTMTINCKRLADVAFSTAYFEAGQQVLVPAGSSIKGYDATLKGKKICSASGSTAETALKAKSFGADISVTVPNQLDCLVRLQLGEVDGVVTDNALAAGQAAQDPSVKLVGTPFTKEFYGVAMNKEATDLVRRVNKVLDGYRQGGANSPWMAAYRKWLAADMPDLTGPPAPKYRTG
ncbi:glutamate ABC transporter substrate-binding protein [Streptomyces sp. A3M-1-3]|uniref:glutamate ABC transporter substrate-binding protein n=1 Tax=Streptomyces sp. A3M-1-3 TaxID=2962044 RepID=UPI0020B87B55|nr:glutamate ABC transporter substrate-binding protein [Streptomyces sp. A3M-1-3]MCP3817772.1 glutamate ABC transporter substrate-binding protein [Streptomyces sp. A3M-1-3]